MRKDESGLLLQILQYYVATSVTEWGARDR